MRVRSSPGATVKTRILMWKFCAVENLITTSSDHYAIMITLYRGARTLVQQLVWQSFRYEAMWLQARFFNPSWINLWWGVSLVWGMLYMSTTSLLRQWYPLEALDKGSNQPLLVSSLYETVVMFTAAKQGPGWATWYSKWLNRSSYLPFTVCRWHHFLLKERQ
jgi:hypothetical protein